jgi:hypothetical protein
MRNIFLIQKSIRIMLGLGPMRSGTGGFKKLDILTVPRLYIFALIMCVVRNPEHSSIQCKDTRQKSQLRLPSVKFASTQKGVTYSSINIFNKLPLNISKLHRDSITCKSVLRKVLVQNAFYSIDEFVSINCNVN